MSLLCFHYDTSRQRSRAHLLSLIPGILGICGHPGACKMWNAWRELLKCFPCAKTWGLQITSKQFSQRLAKQMCTQMYIDDDDYLPSSSSSVHLPPRLHQIKFKMNSKEQTKRAKKKSLLSPPSSYKPIINTTKHKPLEKRNLQLQ